MPTDSSSIIIRWSFVLVAASTAALVSSTAIAQPAGGRMSFGQLDKNGDGKIERAEFPGPDQAFGRIDTNGDGFISPEEFANRLARGPGGGQRPTPTGGGAATGRAGRSEQDLAAVRDDLGKPAADQKINVPEGVKFIADLIYREGNPMWKLDLAMPATPGAALRPGIVFVHGGGWRGGDKRQGYFLQGALDYARRGYVCITVNYRLTGEAPFPACVEDVKTAVRWFRAHAKDYHLDPERIGAYGNSAGAHLVAMLGLAGPAANLEGDGPWRGFSSAIQAVCPSAVPVDFVNWGGPRGVYRGESTLFAGPAETLEERKRLGSPITHVSPQAPPFLVIHGTKDGVVPFSQAEALVSALKQAGASITFMPIEGAGHGVFVEHAATTKPAMEQFFDRHLKRGSERADSAPNDSRSALRLSEASASPASPKDRMEQRVQESGVKAGGRVPNGEVFTLEGAPVALASLWRDRPLLLVTASITCPIAIDTCPSLQTLKAEFDQRVNVAILYVGEAHPKERHPGADGKIDPATGIKTGIGAHAAPVTMAERLTLARLFARQQGGNVRLLVADMDRRVVQQLGTGANSALLIATDGTVRNKQGWYDPAKMQPAISALVETARVPHAAKPTPTAAPALSSVALGRYPDATHDELKKAIASDKLTLIDANGSAMFSDGHIPGAIDFEAHAENLAAILPKDKGAPIIVYCGGPQCLAYQTAAEAMTKLGYTNVRHYSGGIVGWEKAGEPLASVTNNAPPAKK